MPIEAARVLLSVRFCVSSVTPVDNVTMRLILFIDF
jgi:hypothetical protein